MADSIAMDWAHDASQQIRAASDSLATVGAQLTVCNEEPLPVPTALRILTSLGLAISEGMKKVIAGVRAAQEESGVVVSDNPLSPTDILFYAHVYNKCVLDARVYEALRKVATNAHDYNTHYMRWVAKGALASSLRP